MGINKHLSYFLTGLIILTISSCAGVKNQDSVTADRESSHSTSLTQDNLPVAGGVTTKNTALSGAITDPNKVPVTIYQIDNQCNSLIPKQVALSKGNTLEAAIGEVIEQENSADFDLVGYRATVNNQTGIATVDLRLDPNSGRKFASLSSCEQFSLFGSLRKTLTHNSQWQVKQVVFTEQGQEISF